MDRSDHDHEDLVSVIVPTCNRTEFLARAIKSVLDQTYRDYEILVIDDASTVDTEELVSHFNDERIRYLRHEENRGGSAARNTGIVNAKGAYIAFLDDDDEWLPQKLESQMRVFQENPRAGAVYTGFISIEAESGRIVDINVPKKRGYIFEDLIARNIVGTTSTVIVRSGCFDDVGLFDETLPASQDADMWRRLSRKYFFDYVRTPMVRRILHGLARIGTDYDAVIQGFESQLNKFGEEFEERRKAHSTRYYWIGFNNLLRGDPKQARRAFRKAITLYPKRMINYPWLALSYFGNTGIYALEVFERHVWRRFRYIRGWLKARVYGVGHSPRS
jgi:glycosyltransferase involved in cell wall biosynthesis